MESSGKATRIELFNLSTLPMRTFHTTWFAFFLCFFAWFGIAPLMQVVRSEMGFSSQQIGWCVIGSVSVTVLARMLAGWLCDRLGPRLTYTALLVLGSLPVMGIGLAHDFTSFLIFRVLIGAIGASFVITQYHTTQMFASNCIGTANATTAGWGNLGGGVTQFAMPLLFSFLVATLGLSDAAGWRMSMLLVGALCFAAGIAYFAFTKDTPQGNFRELRLAGKLPSARSRGASFAEACRDHRVWVLFAIYGACFGIELTIDNIAVLYLLDYFAYFKQLDKGAALQTAGMVAASFGCMNLFARTLGGWCSDRCGRRWGLAGRVKWLFVALFGEGVLLLVFSQATTLAVAIPLLMAFGLFVKMSNGATFSVVPFVNRQALGSVSGIVGAGGNAGAIAAGFLLKTEGLDWHTALFILGAAVTTISFSSFALTLQSEAEPAAAGAYGRQPAAEMAGAGA
ncbi:MAG TPA: MFS transporter [Pirellulales bacterium]|nr:MFS transporter [Pirellulales bacterium]